MFALKCCRFAGRCLGSDLCIGTAPSLALPELEGAVWCSYACNQMDLVNSALPWESCAASDLSLCNRVTTFSLKPLLNCDFFFCMNLNKTSLQKAGNVHNLKASCFFVFSRNCGEKCLHLSSVHGGFVHLLGRDDGWYCLGVFIVVISHTHPLHYNSPKIPVNYCLCRDYWTFWMRFHGLLNGHDEKSSLFLCSLSFLTQCMPDDLISLWAGNLSLGDNQPLVEVVVHGY